MCFSIRGSRFLLDLSVSLVLHERYVLYCDSQSAIDLAKNSTFYAKSKYIDVRYHSIRDILDAKFLELDKIHIDDNGSYMMTKALLRGKFENCRSIAGMAATAST